MDSLLESEAHLHGEAVLNWLFDVVPHTVAKTSDWFELQVVVRADLHVAEDGEVSGAAEVIEAEAVLTGLQGHLLISFLPNLEEGIR